MISIFRWGALLYTAEGAHIPHIAEARACRGSSPARSIPFLTTLWWMIALLGGRCNPRDGVEIDGLEQSRS